MDACRNGGCREAEEERRLQERANGAAEIWKSMKQEEKRLVEEMRYKQEQAEAKRSLRSFIEEDIT